MAVVEVVAREITEEGNVDQEKETTDVDAIKSKSFHAFLKFGWLDYSLKFDSFLVNFLNFLFVWKKILNLKPLQTNDSTDESERKIIFDSLQL